ncbi:hypothetical protein IT398_01530 [Candidatus Nomurabacteria bacterium]|nr:hypothetical protein [Candidatus Nomurabacteria bacterium]
MLKYFTLSVLLVTFFSFISIARAQSGCPTGYYAKNDVCCSLAAEAPPTGSYGGKTFCFKRAALPPEKVCQKVPGETPGTWCKQSEVCGYGSYSFLITYEFDLCITPPPPGPTINIGSVRDNQTNTWTPIFCNASTEEAGPAGAPYNAFYCQPKKNSSGQIIAPPDRQSCVSGTGDYAGENWCCPEGQQAMVQPRGTPYCALLPLKLNIVSPTAGQEVSGIVPVKVKLNPESGRPGVGKFKQLNMTVKSETTGVFLPPPTPLSFEDGVPDQANQGSPRTYTFSWDTGQPPLRGGNYTIYVSATDHFGNTVNSEPYSVTVKITENSIKSLNFLTPLEGNNVRGTVPVVAALVGAANTISIRLGDFTGPIIGAFTDANGSNTPPNGVGLPKTGSSERSKQRYFSLNWDTKNGPFAVPNGQRYLSLEGVHTSGQRFLSQSIWVRVDNPSEGTPPVSGSSDDRFGPAVRIWAEPSSWNPGSQQLISFKTSVRDPDGISQVSIKVGNLPAANCQGFGQTESSCQVSSVRATSVPVGTTVTVTAWDNSSARRQTVFSTEVKNGSLGSQSSGRQSSSCQSQTSQGQSLLPKSLSGVDRSTLAEISDQGNCLAILSPAESPSNISFPTLAAPASAPSSVLDIGGIIFQLILKILGRGLI